MSDEQQDRCLNYDWIVSYLGENASEEDRATRYHLRTCPRCGLALDVVTYLLNNDVDATESGILEAVVLRLPQNVSEVLARKKSGSPDFF